MNFDQKEKDVEKDVSPRFVDLVRPERMNLHAPAQIVVLTINKKLERESKAN
jgi:hypothetical protein